MNRNTVVLVVIILAVTGMLVAGKYLATRQSGAAATSLALGSVKGQVAPDFELTDLEGKPMKLSSLRGEAVLLNFWATWCGPCKIEIPWLIDLQKKYGAQGLRIVGISMDDGGKDAVAKFTKEMGINYPVAIGNEKVADEYGGVQALPTSFYLGRDGKVVARAFGLISRSEIEDNIKASLSQSRPATTQAANQEQAEPASAAGAR